MHRHGSLSRTALLAQYRYNPDRRTPYLSILHFVYNTTSR